MSSDASAVQEELPSVVHGATKEAGGRKGAGRLLLPVAVAVVLLGALSFGQVVVHNLTAKANTLQALHGRNINWGTTGCSDTNLKCVRALVLPQPPGDQDSACYQLTVNKDNLPVLSHVAGPGHLSCWVVPGGLNTDYSVNTQFCHAKGVWYTSSPGVCQHCCSDGNMWCRLGAISCSALLVTRPFHTVSIMTPGPKLPEECLVTYPADKGVVALLNNIPQGDFEKAPCDSPGVVAAWVKNGIVATCYRRAIQLGTRRLQQVVTKCCPLGDPSNWFCLTGANPCNSIVNNQVLISEQQPNTCNTALISQVHNMLASFMNPASVTEAETYTTRDQTGLCCKFYGSCAQCAQCDPSSLRAISVVNATNQTQINCNYGPMLISKISSGPKFESFTAGLPEMLNGKLVNTTTGKILVKFSIISSNPFTVQSNQALQTNLTSCGRTNYECLVI